MISLVSGNTGCSPSKWTQKTSDYKKREAGG